MSTYRTYMKINSNYTLTSHLMHLVIDYNMFMLNKNVLTERHQSSRPSKHTDMTHASICLCAQRTLSAFELQVLSL